MNAKDINTSARRDAFSQADQANQRLYDVGYAACYAEMQNEIEELMSYLEKAMGLLAKRLPEHPQSATPEPVEREAADGQSSRAPYGSIKMAILNILRAVEEPMRPAAIHLRLVEAGYSFVKVQTIRSTLHKMHNDGGPLANTADGWIATVPRRRM